MCDFPQFHLESTCGRLDRVIEPAAGRHATQHGDDNPPRSLLERSSIGEYGTAELSASGVDRSQLRNKLRLTPTERVEQMVAFVRFVLPLQGALRHRRD